MPLRNAQPNKASPGTLHLVATPIGNLEDMSERAVRVLRSVDLILAEDTRKFKTLAQRFQIKTAVHSFHEHNEAKSVSNAVAQLNSGLSLALVSEAGTPAISDPGYRLIRACQQEHLTVTAVPGPCAAICALSMSGFPTNRFTFVGFLPQKGAKRLKALSEICHNSGTFIIYESPYRILKLFEALVEINAEMEVFLARELTKMYEETLRGSAAELLALLQQRQTIRGEFVVILSVPAGPAA